MTQTVIALNDRPQGTRPHAPAAAAVRQRLALIPVDRQRDENNRDDPQHNVFATAFFLGHARQYTTSQIAIQVSIERPANSGFNDPVKWTNQLSVRPQTKTATGHFSVTPVDFSG